MISPGPGRPEDAGISVEVDPPVRPARRRCWASASDIRASASPLAAQVIRAPQLMHGKVSSVQHDGRGVFRGVSQPFVAGRYHSLVVADPLPDVLEAAARTDDGTLMGVRHRSFPFTACSSIRSRC